MGRRLVTLLAAAGGDRPGGGQQQERRSHAAGEQRMPASTCGGGHPLVDESERRVSGARVVLAGQDESAALSGELLDSASGRSVEGRQSGRPS